MREESPSGRRRTIQNTLPGAAVFVLAICAIAAASPAGARSRSTGPLSPDHDDHVLGGMATEPRGAGEAGPVELRQLVRRWSRDALGRDARHGGDLHRDVQEGEEVGSGVRSPLIATAAIQPKWPCHIAGAMWQVET